MATFSYRAATATGSVAAGTVDADSAEAAIALLQRRQLRPIAVTAGAVEQGARKAGGKVQPAALAKAFAELGVLTSSGLPLDRSLAVLLDNLDAGRLRQAFLDVQQQVKQGTPLSSAITAEDAFPPLAGSMIAAGEANGRLGEALVKLGDTLERSAKLRQVVTSAMIYPALLSVIAFVVILMMLLFVIPQFEGLFDRYPDRVPGMTKVVLVASKTVRSDGPLLLGGVVALVFALRMALRRPAVRRWLDQRYLSLPRLGTLIRRLEAARYARVLGGLLGSGVAMPTALALAQRTIGNSAMARAVEGLAPKVREGASLAAQVAATGQFPRVAVSFMRTGEETAMLPKMLDRLADVLDEEVATALDRLVALLTPAITIVMGVIIATLIGSIMSAIIGLNSFALE